MKRIENRKSRIVWGGFVWFCVVMASCTQQQGAPNLEAVQKVLDDQVAGWNNGDIEEYMKGYWASDSTMFVSGGTVNMGYDALLERYRKSYPDRAAMGVLSFEELSIRELSPTTALAAGVWRLRREKDEPWGRFTLVIENKPEGWRVVYDHTSSGS